MPDDLNVTDVPVSGGVPGGEAAGGDASWAAFTFTTPGM